MKKLLLIEDSEDLAHLYSKKLCLEGWDVIICHDGSEAIQTATRQSFDMIILDLMLPGISGIDVLEQLRTESSTIKVPIIVYTNFGDNFNREKALSYGADEFLLKTEITPEDLSEAIKKTETLKEVEGMTEGA